MPAARWRRPRSRSYFARRGTPIRKACSARCRGSAPRSPATQTRLAEIPGAGAEPASSASRAACSPAAAPSRPISAGRSRRRSRQRRRGHVAACHYAAKDAGGGMSAAARGQRSQEAFPGARRPVWARRAASVYAVDGVSFQIDKRRDAGAGRRVRLRQVRRSAARSCGCSRSLPARSCSTASASTTCSPARCGRCAGACRWCSRTRSRASIRACGCATSLPSRSGISGSPRSSADIEARIDALMDKVRLPRDAAEPLAARVLRRPAPAHRHRPRARRRAGPHRVRRGGLRARRLGQGADREPAAGSAAASSALRCCSSATISRSSST